MVTVSYEAISKGCRMISTSGVWPYGLVYGHIMLRHGCLQWSNKETGSQTSVSRDYQMKEFISPFSCFFHFLPWRWDGIIKNKSITTASQPSAVLSRFDSKPSEPHDFPALKRYSGWQYVFDPGLLLQRPYYVMALDVLSIPAVSAEPELLSSGMKISITDRRNRMRIESIKSDRMPQIMAWKR